MKTPDKIYLTEFHENVLGDKWRDFPWMSDLVINHEYVCKDALLEWAKEKWGRKKLEVEANEDDGIDYGKMRAYQEIIDKLNSM